MELPALCNKDQGILYSDWVIGEYHVNCTCPYKIVRAFKDAKGKIEWEYSDMMGEEEDLWSIKEPDNWHVLDVRGK